MTVQFLLALALSGGEPATLSLRIIEKDPSGKESPLPSRVHLLGPDSKPVQAPGLPFFRDHLSSEGSLSVKVEPGAYTYTVERGPEYRRALGRIDAVAGEVREATVVLERWIDMAARGWWSGETHVHRPLEEMGLLMRAEDLHAAPVLTVWNQQSLWKDRLMPVDLLVKPEPSRAFQILGCEDERRGGALLYLNLSHPLDLRGDGPEHPSPVKHLLQAREQPSAWVDIEKPFWWDVPTWVATGKVHSIGLANNHMCRAQMYESEAWGRPRDVKRLPPPRGNGFYSQEIYYRLLNCGFRLPPSAGSASGVLPNPVGYNRVYVHLDGPFSYEAWWKGLAAGRSFVTNGPMLLVEANGRLPGEVFRAEGGSPLQVSLDIRAEGNDPLESVDIIRDGEVIESLRGDELRGWLRPGPLVFEKSGWFLVRAIARVSETFRFASTAPFHVEVRGSPRRVHRADVEYFLRWIDERIERLEKTEELAGEEREAVLRPHRDARRLFEGLLAEGR